MTTTLPRIYINSDLAVNSVLELSGKQYNYLVNVMRKRSDDCIIVFNSEDGEFKGVIQEISKKFLQIKLANLLREKQNLCNKVILAFAPIKNNNTNLIIQKATELGISKILPILTARTVVNNINYEKLMSIAIEASEQSERLDVPEIGVLANLKKLFEIQYDIAFFCDENEIDNSIFNALGKIKNFRTILIVVGPEGGFTENEREFLKSTQNTIPIRLNNGILRSETAAISAIAIIKAALL